jgi:hypothetical protein
MVKLDDLPNSFEKMNHVQCFNHTMQLSVKALLELFVMATENSDDQDADSSDMPLFEDIEEGEEGEDKHDDDTEEVDEDNNDDDNDNDNDKEDPFDKLDPEAKAQLMEDTQAVRTTLNKVCINSIYLPFLPLKVLFPDSQAIICNCSLHHYRPSGKA